MTSIFNIRSVKCLHLKLYYTEHPFCIRVNMERLLKNQEKVEEMYSDFQISEMLLGEQTSSYNKQIQIRTTIMSQRRGIPYKRLGKEYYDELE